MIPIDHLSNKFQFDKESKFPMKFQFYISEDDVFDGKPYLNKPIRSKNIAYSVNTKILYATQQFTGKGIHEIQVHGMVFRILDHIDVLSSQIYPQMNEMPF